MQTACHHARTLFRNFISRNTLTFGATIVALVSTWCFAADAKIQPETNKEYLRLKIAANKQLASGNLFAALQFLVRAKAVLDSSPSKSLLDQEAILFDLAEVKLEYADTMKNTIQKANIANNSIKLWDDYRNWFEALDSSERNVLQNKTGSLRIQTAMDRIGVAYVTRGHSNSYQIHELFEYYMNLDYTYLNSNSVKRWRTLLHRCPSWKAPLNENLPPLDALKLNRADEACKEQWQGFSDFLSSWIEKQQLEPGKRHFFEEWHKSLERSLNAS